LREPIYAQGPKKKKKKRIRGRVRDSRTLEKWGSASRIAQNKYVLHGVDNFLYDLWTKHDVRGLEFGINESGSSTGRLTQSVYEIYIYLYIYIVYNKYKLKRVKQIMSIIENLSRLTKTKQVIFGLILNKLVTQMVWPELSAWIASPNSALQTAQDQWACCRNWLQVLQ